MARKYRHQNTKGIAWDPSVIAAAKRKAKAQNQTLSTYVNKLVFEDCEGILRNISSLEQLKHSMSSEV